MSSLTIYDAYSKVESQRSKSDIIYRVLFSRNVDELHELLRKLLEFVREDLTGFSSRFEKMVLRVMEDSNRVAKHAMLFFGIFLNFKFAASFIKPTPLVNPNKFKHFHDHILPVNAQRLLNGKYISLQEFTEITRANYIMYML